MGFAYHPKVGDASIKHLVAGSFNAYLWADGSPSWTKRDPIPEHAQNLAINLTMMALVLGMNF